MRLLTLACFLALLLPSFADDKPNVVIFLTDDQGTLDVNCYGSTDLHTPTMDRLAANGVRFTDASAHIVCCPTRAMLLTGRYPQRSGVNHWTQGNTKDETKGRNMALEEVTIAEMLKPAGYRTALFGKWHLGAHVDHGPKKQGFDEFFGHRSGFIDNYNHHFLHASGFHDLYEGSTEVFKRGNYFPELMTERALAFVDRNKEQPFFLYLPFNLPHYPEQADKDFDEHYKDLPMPRRAYAKVVSSVDALMGRVMARLDAHGLTDNTIVIFMSDNGHSEEDYKIRVDQHTSGMAKGDNYGANGGGGNTGKWRGRKAEFFEGGVRVPAIISWPAQLPRGQVRDQTITAMDWLPTLADLCEVETPKAKLDGASLRSILASETAPTHNTELHWGWHKAWAVRQGDWKLIKHRSDKPQLFNLADEKPERTNHSAEQPEIHKRLLGLHEAWVEEVGSR